jgi:hypothetical protein
MHRDPKPDQLRNVTLAASLAAEHYDVHLHTTPELSLKLQHLKATLWCRTWSDRKPWSVHKLDTYQTVCSGYSGPFLHIDDDFFLFEPVPWHDLFAQCAESPEHYEWSRRMPEKWLAEYGSRMAFNMGVFGGRGDWVEAYTLEAYKALRDAPHSLPPNVEQLLLGRCHEKFEWAIHTFAGLDNQNAPSWYRHLMSTKKDPEVQRWVWSQIPQKLRSHLAPPEPPLARPTLSFSLVSPKVTANDVRDWYRRQKPAVREKWQPLDPKHVCLTNTVPGLGDTAMLTDIEHAAHSIGQMAYATSQSPHWGPLMDHCPTHVNKWFPVRVCLPGAHRKWGLGPGHLLQRARRMFGLPQVAVPKGNLVVPGVEKVPGRICFHTAAGPQAEWQRRNVHPRARILYPGSMVALRKLADGPGSFIEVGTARTLFHSNIEDGTGKDLTKLIRLMAECEFFVGINSGPMHVAAALGLKIVALVNFPKPFLLPNLMDTGTVEEEWLYPQQCVLHQDIDSPWWPLATLKNLEAALGGDVYPYWQTDVAEELIREV